VLINGLVVQAAPAAAPAADALAIVVVPEAGPAPLEVTAMAIGLEPGETCAWDFADGTTGAGSVVAHTYWSPGTYTLTLRAGQKTARATVLVGRVARE